MKTRKDSLHIDDREEQPLPEVVSAEAGGDRVEQYLSHLDFSSNSSGRQQLYRRLERQVARSARRPPVVVTVFSRLGAVAMLALVLGAFLGMLRFQPEISPVYTTALSAPHFNPAATPGTAVVGSSGSNAHPRPLPTPLAPPASEDWQTWRTGTLLP